MISSNETSNTKMCIVHKFDQLKLVTNEGDQNIGRLETTIIVK